MENLWYSQIHGLYVNTCTCTSLVEYVDNTKNWLQHE